MSSPDNMRTGRVLGISPENYFPETFFIIYLILAAILRRCGFKDCILYSKHCKRVFDQEMFDTGVVLNLYSEYGVGKSIEPLIRELFATLELDPENNRHNIFFKEIIRLTPEVINIIRSHDPSMETEWMMKYAMTMESVKDDIANERILRMADLLYDIPSSDSFDEEESIYTDSDVFSLEDYSESIEGEEEDIDLEEVGTDDTEEEDMADTLIGTEEGTEVGTEVTSEVTNEETISTDGSDSGSNSFNNSDGSDSSDSDTFINSGDEDIICYCLFCYEFRKYHQNLENRNVMLMINNVLMEITRDIKQ